MSQLIVHTHFSSKDALRLGVTEAGRIQLRPTAEQLQMLSADERAALAQFTSLDVDKDKPRTWYEVLDVTEPGWDGAVAGLRAEMAKDAEKKTERAAHIERERASYRTILAADRLYAPTLPLRSVQPEVSWNGSPNYSQDDPEAQSLWRQIKERSARERIEVIRAADAALSGYELVNGELAPQIRLVLDSREHPMTWEEHEKLAPRAYKFQEQFQAEKAAADKARLEAAQNLAREYVIAHVPDYVQAAEDGCDVRGVAVRHLEKTIESRSQWWRYDDEAIRDVEAHSCPNALAYATLKVAEAFAEDYRQEAIVESIETRIVRAQFRRADGEKTFRTMIELSIKTKADLPDVIDLYLYADAAPEPERYCDSEDDE